MRLRAHALVLLVASAVSSPAFAQSAEETAAFLYPGINYLNEYPNEERISEQPLTFREWIDKKKGEARDIVVEQIDRCRYRFSFKLLGENSQLVQLTEHILDFSKIYYPPTAVESGRYAGIYQARWYPGASCREQEDGSTTCDPDKAVGLRRELSSIQAAVKYMNDKFCKTRAF
jgi:hypothetical protein